MGKMTRRNMMLPDSLWAKIQRAAADEGAKIGKPVSTAEMARRALEKTYK